MSKDAEDPPDEPSATALPSFATVPPPDGTSDPYSAPTTVAALPDSFLEELKNATAEEAAARAAGHDLKATRKNHSFELELREHLTAKLVDVGRADAKRAAAPATTPEASAPEASAPPTSTPSPAPATASASEPPPPDADEPAPRLDARIDYGSVLLITLLALFASAVIAWTYLVHLR